MLALIPHLFSTGPPTLSSGKEEQRKGEGVLITELEGMYALASTVRELRYLCNL